MIERKARSPPPTKKRPEGHIPPNPLKFEETKKYQRTKRKDLNMITKFSKLIVALVVTMMMALLANASNASTAHRAKYEKKKLNPKNETVTWPSNDPPKNPPSCYGCHSWIP